VLDTSHASHAWFTVNVALADLFLCTLQGLADLGAIESVQVWVDSLAVGAGAAADAVVATYRDGGESESAGPLSGPQGGQGAPQVRRLIYMTGQTGFRYCSKCQGLFLGPNAAGECPGGAQHEPSGAIYTVGDQVWGVSHGSWYWCSQCQGVFENSWGSGVCPAPGRGGHRFSVGASAWLLNESPQAGQQTGWWRCQKCCGLFYYDPMYVGSSGTCPAGGGHSNQPQLYSMPTDTGDVPGLFVGGHLLFVTIPANIPPAPPTPPIPPLPPIHTVNATPDHTT
jgi:hypothetical protein